MAEKNCQRLEDKTATLSEAAERFARDGDHFALDSFSYTCVSLTAIHEMIWRVG